MTTDESGRPPYASGASRIEGQSGRAALRRDDQQWLLDYIVQNTGRAIHFQGDARGPLPRTVRSHAMISKHVAKQATAAESLARTEEQQGHRASAMQFYYWAAGQYAAAQHPIFELNDEKRYLAGRLRHCYDKVIEFAPYRIERVEIGWGDSSVVGHLHLNPAAEGPAPVVFYIPGCDVTKESWPNPFFNQAHQRGMHAFSFDGPGQGESILRGIALTADNYERAASAAVAALRGRDEIADDGVLVYATSFGSFWGMRLAAIDHTVRALAAPQASLCEKFIQTDIESPRWKQLFAFLTQAASEGELDTLLNDMTMTDRMGDVELPHPADRRRVRSPCAAGADAGDVRRDDSARGDVGDGRSAPLAQRRRWRRVAQGQPQRLPGLAARPLRRQTDSGTRARCSGSTPPQARTPRNRDERGSTTSEKKRSSETPSRSHTAIGRASILIKLFGRLCKICCLSPAQYGPSRGMFTHHHT